MFGFYINFAVETTNITLFSTMKTESDLRTPSAESAGNHFNPELTRRQFDEVKAHCREIFLGKMHDYGISWRIMRPSSLTDQIYIKAQRIRTIETTGVNRVGDGIAGEFAAIINYGIMALIQCDMGAGEGDDISPEKALELYDNYFDATLRLMLDKNHDYGEAWRQMRVSSFTDIILTKLHRTKQIEDLGGSTLVSEGVESNYMDMINYAVFALIKLKYGE